jgi:sulfur-carrier protein
MNLVYFAQVRETIGIDHETRVLPSGLTVAALVIQLAAEGAHYANAFADHRKLRFALDQHMVSDDALLDGARELAIFPPVTGG